MRSPRILAVDIGASHVACGVFAVGAAGRLVLQHFALEPHSADPSHESRWTVELAQSLGAIATRHKLSGPAALSVPGHLALTKFLKTPSIAKEKRGKILAFEAAENIPYPLDEVVWDHVVVADDGLDLEVMLTAAKTEAMLPVCHAAEATGFPVQTAMPAALALWRGFRYNYPQVRDSVVVANIGARTTHLLFADGERFYVRSLALAGNAVTQSIADELRIDFPSAEALKIQVLSGRTDLHANSPSRLAVARAAAAFASRLQLEITRSEVNHRRQWGGSAPVALYLTGGGSLIPELESTLSPALKLRVERYQTLRNVDLSASARAGGVESSSPVLADLVGLATHLVVRNEADASLLPPALAADLAFRKRQPVFVAAAALGVVALLPPIGYFHHVATETTAQVARIDDQLMPLRSLQTRNEQNIARIEDALKQSAALQRAYQTKANWITFFADLQRELVKIEDVWLDQLRVVRPEIDLTAGMESGTQPAPASTDANPAPGSPAGASGPMAPSAPVRMLLSGRLLDVANPQSKVSPEALQRVKQLLASFAASPFVAGVENERFDTQQNGLLRFDFTLVINPGKTL